MSLGLSLRGRLLVDERLYEDSEVSDKIKEIENKIQILIQEKYTEAAEEVRSSLQHVYNLRDQLHLDNLDVMNGLARVNLIADKFIEKLIG